MDEIEIKIKKLTRQLKNQAKILKGSSEHIINSAAHSEKYSKAIIYTANRIVELSSEIALKKSLLRLVNKIKKNEPSTQNSSTDVSKTKSNE